MVKLIPQPDSYLPWSNEQITQAQKVLLLFQGAASRYEEIEELLKEAQQATRNANTALAAHFTGQAQQLASDLSANHYAALKHIHDMFGDEQPNG